MSTILIHCQQSEKIKSPEEKLALNSSDVTLLHWEKTNDYQLRFRCPLCKTVEIHELSEYHHSNELAKIRRSDATKQSISPPIRDVSGNLPAINHDDIIEFHEQAEHSNRLVDILAKETNS